MQRLTNSPIFRQNGQILAMRKTQQENGFLAFQDTTETTAGATEEIREYLAGATVNLTNPIVITPLVSFKVSGGLD